MRKETNGDAFATEAGNQEGETVPSAAWILSRQSSARWAKVLPSPW
jgi:hypothetical protein